MYSNVAKYADVYTILPLYYSEDDNDDLSLGPFSDVNVKIIHLNQFS